MHSQDEHDFIQGLCSEPSQPVWLGGVRSDSVAGWSWMDGSEFDYTNWDWMNFQPDNRVDKRGEYTQQCISSGHDRKGSDGQWWDHGCSSRQWFVCQRPLYPSTTTQKRARPSTTTQRRRRRPSSTTQRRQPSSTTHQKRPKHTTTPVRVTTTNNVLHVKSRRRRRRRRRRRA